MNFNRLIYKFEVLEHPYGVQILDPNNPKDVEFFFESYYKSFGNRSYLDKSWFFWFYTQNPYGPCIHYILIDLLDRKWLGGIGFAPTSYYAANKSHNGVLAVNGFINPGYENQGLYTKLFRFCLEKETIDGRIVFGFTHSKNIASRKGVLKSGWNEYHKMWFMQITPTITVENDLNIIDSDHPEILKSLIFNNLTKNVGFKFTRSAEYIKWRFHDRPHKNYTYIINTDVDHLGYMILGFYLNSNNKTLCQVVDFGYENPVSFKRMLIRADKIAKNRLCDTLDLLVVEHSESQRLCYDYGMEQRDEGYDMFYFSKDGKVLSNNAHVTYADNDVI